MLRIQRGINKLICHQNANKYADVGKFDAILNRQNGALELGKLSKVTDLLSAC